MTTLPMKKTPMAKKESPPPVVSVERTEPVETSTPMTQKVVGLHTTALEFTVQQVNYKRQNIQGWLSSEQALALAGYTAHLRDSNAVLQSGKLVQTEFDAIRYWIERISPPWVS